MPLPGTTSSSLLPDSPFTTLGKQAFWVSRRCLATRRTRNVTNNFGFNVDFTKTHGAHTMEFGGEIDEYQYGGFPSSGGRPNGSFSFDSG